MGGGGGGGAGGGVGSGGSSLGMVKGEARARADGEFAVFRLMPPGPKPAHEHASDTPEERHFRVVEKLVVESKGSSSMEVGYQYGSLLGKILMVEHVVNPELEAAFEQEKKEMKARLRQAPPSCGWTVVKGVGKYEAHFPKCQERVVFHGTSLQNSEAIMRENFRLDKVRARMCWKLPLFTLLNVVEFHHERAWRPLPH